MWLLRSRTVALNAKRSHFSLLNRTSLTRILNEQRHGVNGITIRSMGSSQINEKTQKTQGSTTGSRNGINHAEIGSMGSQNVVEDDQSGPKHSQVAAAKDKNGNMETLKRILKLALPEKNLIGASMGTLVVTSGISLVFPAAIGRILDLSLADGTGMSPTYVAGGLMGLFVLQGGLIVARTSMLSVAGERLISRFRKQLFVSILSQDMGFFDRTRTGELINRLSADTQMVQKAVTGNMVNGLRNIFMAVGGTCMLFYTSPTLALVSLSIMPPVGLAARSFGRYMKKRQAEVQDALAETSSVAEEVISNIRTVRQFAAEPLEVAKYNTRIDLAYRKACEVGLLNAWFEGSVHLAANFSLVAVLGYGGSLVLSQELTAGALTSFLMYSLYVGFNLTNLSTVYSELMRGVGASTRIFNIVDRIPDIPSSITSAENSVDISRQTSPYILPKTMVDSIYENMEKSEPADGGATASKKAYYPPGASLFGLGPMDLNQPYEIPYGIEVVPKSGFNALADQIRDKLVAPKFDGKIEYKNVSFSYPTRPEVQILNNLNLTLEPGTTTAIVGPSGNGKSTIPHLLMRLYDPQSGQICIDGMDVKDIDPHHLRSNVGVVAQEPVLFSGTIEENLRIGNLQATTEQIEHAAKIASAMNFIQEFPHGMQTRVGERGSNLSGGERQRIAVARAILKDPKILILDEATAALDNFSEIAVQKALDELIHGDVPRTVLVIAHRLTTIRNADQILVLDQGQIIEKGTHNELMAKGGTYADLWNSRAQEALCD